MDGGGRDVVPFPLQPSDSHNSKVQLPFFFSFFFTKYQIKVA